MHPCLRLSLAAVVLLLSVPPTWAAQDQEYNDSCPDAQDLRRLAGGVVHGELGSADAPPNSADVDFYAVRAAPGTNLLISLSGENHGRGGIYDTYLGAFDSSCQLIAANDDFNGPSSRLRITVPADGRYVLGATACCDTGFVGTTAQGGYVLTVEESQPPARISGKVRNSAGPVRTAYVDLFQCPDASYELCDNFVEEAVADSEGNYSMPTESLASGSYQLVASDYIFGSGPPRRSAVFEFGTADVVIDLRLRPPLVEISDVDWSSKSVPDGGTAALYFTLHNHSAAPIGVQAWLAVTTGIGGGAPAGSSTYQSGEHGGAAPKLIDLDPGQLLRVALPLRMPAAALSGSSGFFSLYVSRRGQPMNLLTGVDDLTYTVTPSGTAALLAGPDAAMQRLKWKLHSPPRR